MKTKISFFEIPTSDFTRSVEFYRAAFGYKIEVCDCGESEKMAFFDCDGCAGAIIWSKDFRPSKDGVIISLKVDSIEKTLEQINKNGGKTYIDKTRIECENMGYFAVFFDSEGNRIGLHSNN